jgi:hypothetical protein
MCCQVKASCRRSTAVLLDATSLINTSKVQSDLASDIFSYTLTDMELELCVWWSFVG